LAALTLATITLMGTPLASAQQTRTVSPGDDIVTTADDGARECTLGYTFTNPAGQSYGITAGHCNSHRSRFVTDRTTGAIGHFVLTVGNPEQPLTDDYALIDFGANHSVPLMHGTPVTAMAAPDSGLTVCHDGIATGITCGDVHGRLAGTQCLTSGMPASVPGDSGGPVWQPNHTGATVIGIWLGEHIEPGGSRYGRFTALTDVLADIAHYGGLNPASR
jgi:hypothetical protein